MDSSILTFFKYLGNHGNLKQKTKTWKIFIRQRQFF